MTDDAFETMRADLVRRRGDARDRMRRAGIMLGVIPALAVLVLLFILAGMAVLPIVLFVALGSLYALFGGIGALVMLTAGVADYRRATRELRLLAEPPQARVIVR